MKTMCVKSKALLFSTAFGLLVLPATQAIAQTAAPAPGSAAEVEELIVTAQKRAESTLEVPMGVTALTGEQLQSEQSYRLEDFVNKVPGLNMSESVGAQVVVRGIVSTAGSINAPVATYIDETPLVGVGAFSGGFANTPNLDTFDVARVEVLKGPQGTLYGANALGGLLKYVTNAPDPSGFDAKVQAGASVVEHGGSGYSLHGMVNVPLGETLALRVVGYDSQYPGFIDNVERGDEDVNDYRISGGRASLLWSPNADLSIRLNALYQKRDWGGLNFQDGNPGTLTPPDCTLCVRRDINQPGDSELQYYNATVDWDLGAVDLLSSTTYYLSQFKQRQDLTPLAGAIVDFLFGAPAGTYGLTATNDYNGEEIVHETRLASKLEGKLNWQAGIYYTSKDVIQYQPQLLIDRANNAILYNALSLSVGGTVLPTTYKEFAAFGNLNYQVTPTFDVSVGGRVSEANQTFEQKGSGFSPSAPLTPMSDNVFTWSADARWRPTPDHMVYGRAATGFAPGGPNVAAFNQPIPPAYGSSTTTNYELGYKGKLLDNRLTAELALFQINWEDIQLIVPFGVYTSIANGGEAVSQGLEWAFNYVPVSGLTLGFAGAYTDAHLTKNTPAGVGGKEGDRLPITPRWQTTASVDYRRPVFGEFTGFVGADWRYLSDRLAEFETSHPRQVMPSYDIVDLRAGVESERWTLTVYAKNVGDTVGINFVNDATSAYALQRVFVTTPRTIGVDISVNF